MKKYKTNPINLCSLRNLRLLFSCKSCLSCQKTPFAKQTQFPDPTNLQSKIAKRTHFWQARGLAPTPNFELRSPNFLQNEPNFPTLRIENQQNLDVSGRNDMIFCDV
jgi:hypothetical protein